MSEIKKIDHIGIVVSNLEEGIEMYTHLLKREPVHTECLAASEVELAFFDVEGVQIELLAPTGPDSAVMPFLKETGGGIHHTCYEVSGIEELLEELKGRGFKLMDEHPKPGSRNTRIAFVDAESTQGVCVEYCEYPRD